MNHNELIVLMCIGFHTSNVWIVLVCTGFNTSNVWIVLVCIGFHISNVWMDIVQELCESRGGRPGLSALTSLLVSVDVKLY